jgi:hypothetical protein
MSDVRVAVLRGDLRCYLARPDGHGPRRIIAFFERHLAAAR